MPYAFLNPDGTIKQVFLKPSPMMRLGEYERMVNYNPPPVDPSFQVAEPVMPVEGLDVQFRIVNRPTEDAWAAVRLKRDSLLVESDWVALPDVPMPETTRAAWLEYRQALRDVTEQDDPFNIIWPVRP